MDFAKYDASDKINEGEWMVLKDPYGEDTDARIKIVGTDSKIFKRRLHRLADQERKRKGGLKAADMEREMLETYAACCVDFENCFYKKKEIKPDNFEDVLDFLSISWVVNQVSLFAGDYTNFLSS